MFIPICETLDITKNLLLRHNNEHITKQISLLHTILQQNYFAFQNNIFQPHTGIAMESPISGIIAEIFLQYLENKHLNQLLDEKSIIFYTRYVDDLFLIYEYNTDRTTPEKIHDYLTNLHPNLEFTPTIKENNRISFLDLLITRQTSAIEIDTYRKPTATDTTINYTSNHPTEHKLAAYRYLIRRMTALPLSPEKEEAEWQTILTIANNNFPIHIIRKLKTHTHNKEPTKNNEHKKWTTFTYHSTKVRKITNLFKHRHQNSIQKHQHNRPKNKAQIPPLHPKHGTKWHLRTNLQDMPKSVYKTNKQKSYSKVPRAYTIHKKQ
jgi:hypothetical protein